MDVDKARQTQLANIQKKTGKTLDELAQVIHSSGLSKHGQIYIGPKAALRPIHDALLAGIRPFGSFEIAPKKGYVSLRRQKQFAMLGPATNTRVEVGLNMKGVPTTGRLEAMPPGQMCQYKVRLTDMREVDAELVAWVRTAYDQSGPA